MIENSSCQVADASDASGFAWPQAWSLSRVFAKAPLFIVEALNSLVCCYFANYIFFHFRDCYGFGDRENLGVAALIGLVAALASWHGGRFAQRRGYLRTIFLGQAGMILAWLAGAAFGQMLVQLAVLTFWTVAQFFVWPALQALIADGETRRERTRLLGVYNVVWATATALSYFLGGALFERLGSLSIFWLPPAVSVVEILILLHFARRLTSPSKVVGEDSSLAKESSLGTRKSGVNAIAFQRMAWAANPFACVAMFSVLAMIPQLALKLGLNTTQAGWFCSIWFFARLAAFVLLWRWTGWHYRFFWLLVGYASLVVGFFMLLMAVDLWWLILGQVAFGFAVGLLYYSSLFYSMDVGQTRAVNSGIHEAAMGAGRFVGPGVGALSLALAPQWPEAGIWSVGSLLMLGLVALGALRLRFRIKPDNEASAI